MNDICRRSLESAAGLCLSHSNYNVEIEHWLLKMLELTVVEGFALRNLTNPRRPIGVFMMVGPSGVGKTETAMALADILDGGERNTVIINMSEY